MEVVIGMPVKDRAWCLEDWFKSVETQETDASVHVAVLYTESSDDTLRILRDRDTTIIDDEEPGRPIAEIDDHLWGKEAGYTYMARVRNKLLDKVEKYFSPDYYFSLDSDIMLPPDGLQRLLDYAQSHPGVVSPAVNMTQTGTAWNTMSWTDRFQPGTAFRPVKMPAEGQSDVIMAAMLLDRSGMDCCWAPHYQGEDVGFSLDARARKVPLWWTSTITCEHRMRKVINY